MAYDRSKIDMAKYRAPVPGKHADARIKPLAVGEWPLHIAAINL